MSSSPTETVVGVVDVLMPQMGTSVSEGTLVEWRVAVGDHVAEDDTICEISTDKVDSECPAPATGTVVEILVAAGETVDVGVPIARIADGDGTHGGEAPAAPADGPADDDGRPDTHAGDPPAPAALVPGATPSATGPSRRELLRRSSPVALRVAGEHGIDVTTVAGSGRNGRVTKRDVEAAITARATDAGPAIHSDSPYRPDPAIPVAGSSRVSASGAGDPATTTTAAATDRAGSLPVPMAPDAGLQTAGSTASAVAGTSVDVLAARGGTAEPLSRMRGAIGRAMRGALDTAAHCTTIVECDMSAIERRRRELGLTALPLVATATIATLREFPALNATLQDDTVVRYDRVHLGIAVSLGDDGLIVPVIDDAQDLSAEGLGRRIKDVAGRARTKQLEPDEVRGGTFTITNPGAFGALIATPVINVPQVAILDLEAIVKRPVVITDEHGRDSIAIRPMVNLCMSWDHRAIDGVYAAQFLTALRRRLEG
ncbi:MAG: dihydrolipoamide acetyltransferase family protein [Solirubrobacteraceae bacterium]